MTGIEIYKRTPTYEKKARDIRLHEPEWKLLLAFDGQRSVAEVALSAEVSFAEALPLTQKFLVEEWIEEQPITLDQYLKRKGARDISAGGASVPPAVVLHEPGKAAPAAPSAPAVPPATPPHAPPPLPAAPSPAKPIESAAAPEKAPAAKSSRSPMKLSAVVDFITSLVGNISLGQLLVYRVFLRVPPELLLAEDIASVHLANDTSLIQGEKLQKAIADAVNAVTKRQLPDSVFAPA
jgi:hypothetical protein